jgi:hypothetical protein
MQYKKGYKYQLVEPVKIYVGIFLPGEINTKYLRLYKGYLYIDAGYAWDGPSGPMVDTDNLMLPSLTHDGLYQLMRMGLIPHSYWKHADKVFVQLAKERGVWAFRRWYALKGLRLAQGSAARIKNAKKVLIAP